MRTALTIALFSAGGGLSRYYLSGWVYYFLGRGFPYGTLVVNFIGAYFIGLIMELALHSPLIPHTLRLGITVGFLGGLTTFSTFSYETFTLLKDGQHMAALLNIALSVGVCLLLTWLGIVTARAIS